MDEDLFNELVDQLRTVSSDFGAAVHHMEIIANDLTNTSTVNKAIIDQLNKTIVDTIQNSTADLSSRDIKRISEVLSREGNISNISDRHGGTRSPFGFSLGSTAISMLEHFIPGIKSFFDDIDPISRYKIYEDQIDSLEDFKKSIDDLTDNQLKELGLASKDAAKALTAMAINESRTGMMYEMRRYHRNKIGEFGLMAMAAIKRVENSVYNTARDFGGSTNPINFAQTAFADAFTRAASYFTVSIGKTAQREARAAFAQEYGGIAANERGMGNRLRQINPFTRQIDDLNYAQQAKRLGLTAEQFFGVQRSLQGIGIEMRDLLADFNDVGITNETAATELITNSAFLARAGSDFRGNMVDSVKYAKQIGVEFSKIEGNLTRDALDFSGTIERLGMLRSVLPQFSVDLERMLQMSLDPTAGPEQVGEFVRQTLRQSGITDISQIRNRATQSLMSEFFGLQSDELQRILAGEDLALETEAGTSNRDSVIYGIGASIFKMVPAVLTLAILPQIYITLQNIRSNLGILTSVMSAFRPIPPLPGIATMGLDPSTATLVGASAMGAGGPTPHRPGRGGPRLPGAGSASAPPPAGYTRAPSGAFVPTMPFISARPAMPTPPPTPIKTPGMMGNITKLFKGGLGVLAGGIMSSLPGIIMSVVVGGLLTAIIAAISARSSNASELRADRSRHADITPQRRQSQSLPSPSRSTAATTSPQVEANREQIASLTGKMDALNASVKEQTDMFRRGLNVRIRDMSTGILRANETATRAL